ncbi:MAG: alanine dehydrogenase [Candidatus Micrarchaeota archaeon]|nr:alanine dehydrogenase [Candidatus Micrarchaeota archaeon]
MIVGVPKEIKDNENRVGMTPAGVMEMKKHGHTVYVQKNGGVGSGFSDEEYKKAGAQILDTAEEVFAKSEMIVKVKEPQPVEINMLNEKHLLFTYLHLAPDRPQTEGLLKNKVTAVAYETVAEGNYLPLLAPMSEVAGRMAIFVAAYYLAKPNGGMGLLMSGVPGTKRAKVVVIGGGFVGTNAAKIAYGVGADLTILDNNIKRIRELDLIFPKAKVLMSNTQVLEEEVKKADVVIGAVLIPGAKAPKLVTKKMVETMKPGSVIVDVAIDQGGCCENSRPTKHSDPIFKVNDVIHYCVANMPGAYARTSTMALTNSTLPYALQLEDQGIKVVKESPALLLGLNTYKGKLTCKGAADALGIPYVDPKTLL